MKNFYQQDSIEIGIDEAGRGCLIGPVCVSGVIMGDIESNPPPYQIRDSKKCSPKIRNILREYIENHSIAYTVQLIDSDVVDKLNILNATLKGMTQCVDDIRKQIDIDRILVDGNQFNIYMTEDFEPIEHICIPKGDDKYINIAAASILAKEYHDDYIKNLVNENSQLQNYNLLKNKGYGTKDHMNAIKEYGSTKWHRKSFKLG
jgi:ribonuclease HII